ncbi:unnamed protein product, partial [Brenthis ino]
MSAKKGFETKVLEDESADLGFHSGPLSEQLLSSEELNTREDVPVESDKKVISETEIDSGLDLCLSEPLSNISLSESTPTAQGQGPLIYIDDKKHQDIQLLTILFQQDDDGDTQLHIAAVHGCQKSVGTLIRVCPDKAWLDIPNDYGHTPLHLAAMSGHAVVARMLVRAGASIGARDVTGETPLHKAVAIRSQECIQALNPVPEHPTRLSTVLNQKNYKGQCCVHLAATAGYTDMLQQLVYLGADINARDGLGGWTPLHIAARRGDVATVQFLLRVPAVQRAARDYAGRAPRRLARRTRAHALFPDDNDDDEDDDERCPCLSDSEGETFFEKYLQSGNPINVA